jgi:SSS family solute:Na+ symporter
MALLIVVLYLGLLLGLGIASARFLRQTAGDYFLASRGIGSFMLLMSIFGTTMTAFALIGSTGESFSKGIGVYGLMASWSGIVHSAVFFLVGARVWRLGKQYGYVTQLSYFRDRYQSDALALFLFPLVTCFVLIYVLMGVVGSGRLLQAVTPETWSLREVRTEVDLVVSPQEVLIPDEWRGRLAVDLAREKLVLTGSIAPKHEAALRAFSPSPAWQEVAGALFREAPSGALPYPAGMGLICLVVLAYVFLGGMRATAWANTFQTLVFMGMGLIAFVVILQAIGGPAAATQRVLEDPEAARRLAREGLIGQAQFLTYGLIPLSVGMFTHLFQHWLTARRASSFKLTVVAFPLCILVTWLPCVLLGLWASGVLPAETRPNLVLGMMVNRYSGELLSGLISAGILAAIMSSMDSQFLCLGSIFTNDIVARYAGAERIGERGRVLLGRGFVVLVVVASYLLGLANQQSVFKLGIWCFTGFSSLFPVLFASLYWRRSNKQGAIAAVLVTGILWLAFLPRVLKGGEEDFLILGMLPVTFIFAASSLTLVLVTLLTPAPPASQVERFFPRSPAVYGG